MRSLNSNNDTVTDNTIISIVICPIIWYYFKRYFEKIA